MEQVQGLQGRHIARHEHGFEARREEIRPDVELARDYYEQSGLSRMVWQYFSTLDLGMRGELLEWQYNLPVVVFGTSITTEHYLSLRRGVRIYFDEGFMEILASVAQDQNLEGTEQRMKSYIIGQPALPIVQEELPAISVMLEVAWRCASTVSEEDLLDEAAWVDEIEALESSWKVLREL